MRVKSLQQVIDSQSERMAAMATDRELAALGRQDESTGQGQRERGREGGRERGREREGWRERERGRERDRERCVMAYIHVGQETFAGKTFANFAALSPSVRGFSGNLCACTKRGGVLYKIFSLPCEVFPQNVTIRETFHP